MQRNGDSYEISSRPSDAIALAVRLGRQIFASEEVLDEASILIPGGDEDEEVEKFREFLDERHPRGLPVAGRADSAVGLSRRRASVAQNVARPQRVPRPAWTHADPDRRSLAVPARSCGGGPVCCGAWTAHGASCSVLAAAHDVLAPAPSSGRRAGSAGRVGGVEDLGSVAICCAVACAPSRTVDGSIRSGRRSCVLADPRS